MSKFTYMQQDGKVFQTMRPEYYPNAEKLSQAKGKELYREQCKQKLSKLLDGIDTVYGIVRHVSASGMSRDIDLYIIQDNRPVYLTGYASTVLDYPMSKNQGMKVGGCGMNMVFHCVNSLSSVVFGDGYKIKHEII